MIAFEESWNGSDPEPRILPCVMRHRFRLRLPGLLFITLTIFVGFAAAHRPNNLVVWAFGVLLALIFVSGLISGSMMIRMCVTRMETRRAAAGEPLELRYLVENRSRFRAAFAMRIEEVPDPSERFDFSLIADPAFAWTLRVGPGESQVCDAILWPRRRGIIILKHLRISSCFPFGLIERYVEFERPQRVLVQPRLHAVRGDLLQTVSKGEIGGIGVSRNPGPGEDFYSVREFKPGDSVRHIAWKRLGRNEELFVVQRSISPPPRIRVMLDLTVPTDELKFDSRLDASAPDLEERAIVMAASILAAAEKFGIEFGLTILGCGDRPIPLRRGYWHRERVLTTLAAVDLEQERLAPPPFSANDEERAAVVAIHPGRVDPRIAPKGSWHWSASQFAELLDVDSIGSGGDPRQVMDMQVTGVPA